MDLSAFFDAVEALSTKIYKSDSLVEGLEQFFEHATAYFEEQKPTQES